MGGILTCSGSEREEHEIVYDKNGKIDYSVVGFSAAIAKQSYLKRK
jgi:hypothetical protein